MFLGQHLKIRGIPRQEIFAFHQPKRPHRYARIKTPRFANLDSSIDNSLRHGQENPVKRTTTAFTVSTVSLFLFHYFIKSDIY